VAVLDRRSQHVVDAQLDIGRIVPVVDHRESVGRLDTQDGRPGSVACFADDEAGFDALFVQKIEDKIADRVLPQDRQDSCFQPQALGANTNIRRRAAHVGGEGGEGCADVIAIEVDGGASHVQSIVAALRFTHTTSLSLQTGTAPSRGDSHIG
jgi:hypothetical protein